MEMESADPLGEEMDEQIQQSLARVGFEVLNKRCGRFRVLNR